MRPDESTSSELANSVGEKDRPNFKGSQYLNRGIKGSKLEIIVNTGHTVMIEKPNEFNQLVQQFITEK